MTQAEEGEDAEVIDLSSSEWSLETLIAKKLKREDRNIIVDEKVPRKKKKENEREKVLLWEIKYSSKEIKKERKKGILWLT